MEFLKVFRKKMLLHIISIIIMSLMIPAFIILDIFFEIYHQICFPIYKIPKLKRSKYIQVFDRSKLKYLNFFQKLGCIYCGYANGLLAYTEEIANITEKYWCGIMHKNRPGFKPQEHQIRQKFAKFNDEKDFNKKYR